MSDIRWKATIEDGTEVFVELDLQYGRDGQGRQVQGGTVAFRAKPHHSWGPPTLLERAP